MGSRYPVLRFHTGMGSRYPVLYFHTGTGSRYSVPHFHTDMDSHSVFHFHYLFLARHIHKDSGFPAASLLLIVLTVPASPPALPMRHMTDRTLILLANHFRKIYTSYSFLLLSDPCRG